MELLLSLITEPGHGDSHQAEKRHKLVFKFIVILIINKAFP